MSYIISSDLPRVETVMPLGPQGPPGTSVRIVGTVATFAALPAVGEPGDGYLLAQPAGDLAMWDSRADPPAWSTVGNLLGPPGAPARWEVLDEPPADPDPDTLYLILA